MSLERLFQTHTIREQKCLDGIWDFQIIDDVKLPLNYKDTLSVPGCWEMTIKYGQYIGCAAYRKTINVNENGNLRLLFKGISHTGIIYFDGQKVGFHYNAYTPFSIILPYVTAGKHILEIIVDNQFNESSRLHIPNDYYTYGGITRPVFQEMVPDCYIERSEFVPINDHGSWHAIIKVFVRNCSCQEAEVVIESSCAEATCTDNIIVAANSEAIAQIILKPENVRPWNHDNPNLYFLENILYVSGIPVDDFIDRVGFRDVSILNKKILINGNPVFLKGVNRHEDHGICGCAIPMQLLDADIKLIQELGANAVRTSHYPNDERFLDLCDEKGIFVWEESHDRGGDATRITHPLFIEQSMKVMHEMMEYHYNHPSIIMWGCLNEAASNCVEGCEVYRMHMNYLASDLSRICTYASNKHGDDMCLEMTDVCSFNIYPYWYGEENTDELMAVCRRRMEETGNGSKPIIISEFGGGGIYNFHDVRNVKWSEECQAQILEKTITELFNMEDITGIFIWQYCDTRVSQGPPKHWPLTRPLSRNNKGLVDEYRRPKMAYYVVKRLCN